MLHMSPLQNPHKFTFLSRFVSHTGGGSLALTCGREGALSLNHGRWITLDLLIPRLVSLQYGTSTGELTGKSDLGQDFSIVSISTVVAELIRVHRSIPSCSTLKKYWLVIVCVHSTWRFLPPVYLAVSLNSLLKETKWGCSPNNSLQQSER